ncbi:cytochrome b5 [Stemphylium lycopersici]|nr:cytochrome b5 [Stemphylium lycopersici]
MPKHLHTLSTFHSRAAATLALRYPQIRAPEVSRPQLLIPIPPPPPPPCLTSTKLQSSLHAPNTASLSRAPVKRRRIRPSIAVTRHEHYTAIMSESLTTKQVAEHNTVEKGLYIIVDNDVYKMDTFVDEHPGGAKILKRVGGKDASKQFWKYHNESVLKKYAPKLKIGSVKEEAKL